MGVSHSTMASKIGIRLSKVFRDRFPSSPAQSVGSKTFTTAKAIRVTTAFASVAKMYTGD